MQTRTHVYLSDKQKSSPYHYSQWDVCRNYPCNHLQHYEKFKVCHNNDMATYLKFEEERDNLFKNL